MGGNIVYTLLLATNHDWSFSLVANCKIKSCLAACTRGVQEICRQMLPFPQFLTGGRETCT